MNVFEGVLEALNERTAKTGRPYINVVLDGRVFYCWNPGMLSNFKKGDNVRLVATGEQYPVITSIRPIGAQQTLTLEAKTDNLSGHFIDVRNDIAQIHALLIADVYPAIRRIEAALDAGLKKKTRLTELLEQPPSAPEQK